MYFHYGIHEVLSLDLFKLLEPTLITVEIYAVKYFQSITP